MRVQGTWDPSGQAISEGLFLLGFCVILRIWAAVGESSPSLISLLSRAVGADAEDTGGLGLDPFEYSESHVPCGSQVSFDPDTHLHSPQRLAQVWTLDLKGQCKVCQLGAAPPSAISIMRGEQDAAPHRPLSYKVARGISN